MKKLLFIYGMALCLLGSGCIKSVDGTKPGVSLPTVTNLSLQKLDAGKVKITWQFPGNIPSEIQQPLSVVVQVNELVTVMKAITITTATLPNAPTEYNFTLPHPESVYHFTVKLFGVTKTTDKNYSSNIYSPGQTVEYKK